MHKLRPSLLAAANHPLAAMARGGLTKQHLYSQPLLIQHQRRYQHNYAANQYRAIFAMRPHNPDEVTTTPMQEVPNKVKSTRIAYNNRKGANHGTY